MEANVPGMVTTVRQHPNGVGEAAVEDASGSGKEECGKSVRRKEEENWREFKDAGVDQAQRCVLSLLASFDD